MSANDNIPTRESQTPSGGGRTGKERACPICGKPPDKRYDPFCSRRCADIDLHRWFRGAYVIPGEGSARKPSGEEE
jgi:endogenous inhibitor of DNA gyrase (YacG/DUF329 family)